MVSVDDSSLQADSLALSDGRLPFGTVYIRQMKPVNSQSQCFRHDVNTINIASLRSISVN